MAKTTIILELEYPEEIIAQTVRVVSEENPELAAEGKHPRATDEELALNGMVTATLEQLVKSADRNADPIFVHGRGYKLEAENTVGDKEFPLNVTLAVFDGDQQ